MASTRLKVARATVRWADAPPPPPLSTLFSRRTKFSTSVADDGDTLCVASLEAVSATDASRDI